MNATIICYVLYLLFALTLTVWVARTLHRHGRIFLVQAFRGNEEMADAVNHLLVVGFYLINLGFIAFALRYGTKPTTAQEGFEFVSTKVGVVLLVLGGMHFFNLFNFDRMRRKGQVAPAQANTPPPIVWKERPLH